MNPDGDELDETEARLQEQFPGHQIWYVPRAGQPPLWYAQRLPLITAGSPGELAVALSRA